MKDNKDKIYDFEIEDFTEEDLYGEGLSEKEIMKTKKNMVKILKLIKDLNKELNIEIDLEDILKIRKELGEESEVIEYGVRNARLLKKIVLDAIDKEVKNQDIEIIDELFIPTQIAIPGRVDTVALHGCTYFYKMYLTNHNLIIYSLSDKYELIKKRSLNFDELQSIGKAPRNKGFAKGLGVFANTYDGNQSFIEPKDRTTMYINHTEEKYKEEVIRFLDKLSEVSEVRIITEFRWDVTDYFALVFNIVCFGSLIYIVIKDAFF